MGGEETKGSACGREQLLVTVLYGEATDAEREQFAAHRAACAACDEEFAAFASVREQLRGWEVGAVPSVRVEVRPGFVERLRRAFAVMPAAARVAAAGACALALLAAVNTEVSVGPGGLTFRTGLAPRPAAAPGAVAAAPAGLTKADVERIVAERAGEAVREHLVAYRAELDVHLKDLERQLVTARSTDDVRRLSAQVAAQRRKIDRLERDLDRTTGYGGADLFGAVLAGQEDEPGS